ncbi:hypothetical protein VNO80_23394 [Phaseolus coccineus]|uniref:Uncharacterized protein n=1 Tax=Phaseolus coccineus TaxID=3886 RepID=A0AAN9MB77_PHACN
MKQRNIPNRHREGLPLPSPAPYLTPPSPTRVLPSNLESNPPSLPNAKILVKPNMPPLFFSPLPLPLGSHIFCLKSYSCEHQPFIIHCTLPPPLSLLPSFSPFLHLLSNQSTHPLQYLQT